MDTPKVSVDQFSEMPVVAAATVKLPVFWPEQPTVWFAQAESQFAIKGISTDETKYHYVVASLDQSMATRIVDLLTSPPPKGTRYATLKDRLISTFSLSSYQRARRLIRVSALGDRTPSELMDEMLGMLGNHEACFLFKTLFMDQLPEDIRTHLIPMLDESSPRTLALAADKLMTTRQVNINVVYNKQKSSSLRDGSDHMCRFHKKWGRRAYRCEGQCSFERIANEPRFQSAKSRVLSIQGNEEFGHQ